MKLNDYNKSIISTLANQLVKLQNDNRKSNKAI